MLSGRERLLKSKERKKQMQRERSKKCYAQKIAKREEEKQAEGRSSGTAAFSSRQSKKSALQRVQDVLPRTPEKKALILEQLIESPETKQCLSQKQSREDRYVETANAVLKDAREAISSIKNQRNDDARTAMNVGISILCGSNVSEAGGIGEVASKLGVSRRRISLSLQHRSLAMQSVNQENGDRKTSWTYLNRKTRNDSIPEESRKIAHDFWASAGVSRPTGNKRDSIKQRIGVNEYIEHEKQILEQTQTEVFQAFNRKYPDIKIGQRYFEGCKPFYVHPARPKDRITCCCRAHVEIHMLFKSAMAYRKTVDGDGIKVYNNLSDLVADTLCDCPEGERYNSKLCIDRQCRDCGVAKIIRLQEETVSDEGKTWKWQRFQYVTIGESKKLQLVTKTTPVAEMFEYLITLLQTFPAHQFRAQWQQTQMKLLLENLPAKHAICVHDYSESYSCVQHEQIQSMYYSQLQASIHVTILHRPAVSSDGEDMSSMVTEHLFVISPDTKHDSHSVQQCRELVAQHLKDIRCDIEMMHEWTDGCSAQYKSRHCMGDISASVHDFGFPTIRNFFETSHAKGPQDGAGANLKHKCDIAVIQRKVVIQNAENLYDYAKANFEEPAPSRYQSENVRLKRRVYFYVKQVNRDRPYRQFSEIKGNRSIHSILGESDTGTSLKTRPLSCYCENCLSADYKNCINKNIVPDWSTEVITPERMPGDQRVTRAATMAEQTLAVSEVIYKGAIITVASGDPGEDYYLLKVTCDSTEVLNRPLIDDWGVRYPAGAKIIRGHFLEKCASADSLFHYKEVTNKLAVVYAETVRFVCQELEADNHGIYTITIEKHETFLETVNGY